jgi:hypothetical protein
MARSDLVVSLVKAETVGDRRGFRSTAEAISAEQRAKRHNVLANQVTHVIQSNGSGPYGPVMTAPVNEQAARARDSIAEAVTLRKLDELILPPVVRRAVDELVDEQQGADVLRANGLES